MSSFTVLMVFSVSSVKENLQPSPLRNAIEVLAISEYFKHIKIPKSPTRNTIYVICLG